MNKWQDFGDNLSMIAVKNLQNMSGLLLQEEVLQAVAADYISRVTDKKVSKMLQDFVTHSIERHTEMYKYVAGHQ